MNLIILPDKQYQLMVGPGLDKMVLEHLISGRQIRMARAALGWRVDDLSKKSGVSWARIQKIERNNEISSDVDDKLISIKKIFENYGIVFCGKNEKNEAYILIKNKLQHG